LSELHAKLNITQAQEGSWTNVTQVMRDHAHTIDPLIKAWADHAKTKTMTANTRAKHVSSTVGKIVMVFAFASVIGGLSMVPAFGQDHDRRQRQQEHARYEREWQDERGRRVYRPYGYSAPLSAPPPVV
jgi:hypothetical protein